MGAGRLILVPQLPVELRYQEWWLPEMVAQLKDTFGEILVLGRGSVYKANRKDFAPKISSLYNELEQMRAFVDYFDVGSSSDDVLLHCDLSFPGLFHSILAHHRPARCVAICHASAKNKHDLFAPIRTKKWAFERAAAAFYDKVLVATQYHARKLNLPNTVVMGALPDPPRRLYEPTPDGVISAWAHRPPSALLDNDRQRRRTFPLVSVARPCRQKVDSAVEGILAKWGNPIYRPPEPWGDWMSYYAFLYDSEYLVITACEETYGYQVVDAVKMGCIPIAPNSCSYRELLPREYLYDTWGSPTEKAKRICQIVMKDLPVPTLRTDNAAQGFWDRLKKELTTWG